MGEGRSLVLLSMFFFLGMGTLLPWNAFITESGFFQVRLKGLDVENTFESAFGFAYNLANIVVLLLLLQMQQFIGEKTLVVLPFLGTGMLFAGMAALALDTEVGGRTLFDLSMACVLVSGLLAAPGIAGSTGLTASFSRENAGSFFSGQAFAGVAASVVSLVTTGAVPMKSDFCKDFELKRDCDYGSGVQNNTNTTTTTISTTITTITTGFPDDRSFFDGERKSQGALLLRADEVFEMDWGAFTYFSFASVTCFACVFVYFGIKCQQFNPVTDGVGGSSSGGVALGDQSNADALLVRSSNSNDVEEERVSFQLLEGGGEETDEALCHVSVCSTGSFASTPEDAGLTVDEYNARKLHTLPADESWEVQTVLEVMRITSYPCAGVLLVFWVSLSIFPSVVAITESSARCHLGSSRFQNDLFVPMLFLLFNLCDLVGRVLVSKLPPLGAQRLFLFSVSRIVFIPLFALVRVHNSQFEQPLGGDVWPLLLCTLCGSTNGAFGTACMIYAPRLVPFAHRNLACTLSVLALTIGLLLGSISSFAVVNVVQGDN